MKKIFLLICVLLTSLYVQAQEQCGYAVFDSSTSTLTFKYGIPPSGSNVYLTDNTNSLYGPSWPNDKIKKVIFEPSFANARPKRTTYWFDEYDRLNYYIPSYSIVEEIVGLQYLNTSEVTNMSNMFGSSRLKSLDLSHFDTSNVVSMSGMFWNCSSLTDLDLSSFDTSKVEDMYSMFRGCSSLKSLNFSNFDMSKVRGMSYMFGGCSSLTNLELRIVDTNNAKTRIMSSMFDNCSSLTSLDLSHFNTSSVTNMNSMFRRCSSLTTLDLSHFDTSNVEDISWMFDDCSALTTIYVSDLWNTQSLTSGFKMFFGCKKLIGGKGTQWSSDKIDYTYARIDGGASAPGYFTLVGTKDNKKDDMNGDVNGDGKVDRADIEEIVKIIVGTSDNPNGDVTCDGKVNVADIVAIVNIMMTPEPVNPTPDSTPVPSIGNPVISFNVNIVNNTGSTITLDGDVTFVLCNPDHNGNYFGGYQGPYFKANHVCFSSYAVTLAAGETRMFSNISWIDEDTKLGMGETSPLNPNLLNTIASSSRNVLVYVKKKPEVVLCDNLDPHIIFREGGTYTIVLSNATDPTPVPTPVPTPTPDPTPTPNPTPDPTPDPTPSVGNPVITFGVNIVNNTGTAITLDGDLAFLLGNPDHNGNYFGGYQGFFFKADHVRFSSSAVTLAAGETRAFRNLIWYDNGTGLGMGETSPLDPSRLSEASSSRNVLVYVDGKPEMVLCDNMDPRIVFLNGGTYNIVLSTIGSNPTPVNPTPEPSPEPSTGTKRIKTITKTDGKRTEVAELKYDEEGRIKQLLIDGEICDVYSYSGNTITISEGGDSFNYTISNGRIVSGKSFLDGDYVNIDRTFTYNGNNQLVSIVNKETEPDYPGVVFTTTESWNWSGSNLSSWSEVDVEDTETSSFTYSNITGAPVITALFGFSQKRSLYDFYEILAIYPYLGTLPTNLFKTVKHKDAENRDWEYNYAYEQNGNGVINKVTISFKDKTYVYTIEWE